MRIYVNDLSRLVDGPTTLTQARINAAVIQSEIVTGVVLHLRPGSRVSVAGQLCFAFGQSGIVWDGSGTRPYLHMPAAWFTNVNPRNTETARAALIRVTGGRGVIPNIADLRFEGIGIDSDTSGGRYVTGISAINVRDFHMLGCEITGIPNGMGVTAGSLFGNSQICDNRIHDFFDNSVVAANGKPWSDLVQSTAIELDNNRYRASVGVLIAGNRIERIMKGVDFASLPKQGGGAGKPLGMQTDGINIGHYSCDGTRIVDNYIDTVDECIDSFGSNGTINGNQLRNAYTHGLKLVHGAQNNHGVANVIANAGRMGIVICAAVGKDERTVSRNVISGGDISGVGYNGVWQAHSTVAAIRFECLAPGPDVYNPTDNVIIGTTIHLDRRCPIGWRGDDAADADLQNLGEDIRFVGSPSRDFINIPASKTGKYNGRVSLAGSRQYHTVMKAT